MPVLKYKDPADGLWKPVPVGGAAPPVAMNDLTDADTVTSVPAVGDALVWDGTGWVPSGPAVLTPPAPTVLSHAGRYVDGIPRCADVAARTALFPAPVAGDRCYMEDTVQFVFYNHVGMWTAIGGHMPYGQARIAPLTLPAGLSRINAPFFVGQSNFVGGVIWDTVNNCLELPVQGHYTISASMDFEAVPVTGYAQVYVGTLTDFDGGSGTMGRPADAGYASSAFVKGKACAAGTKVSLWANVSASVSMTRADLQVTLTTV